MADWTAGYTQSQLDAAQDRYGLVFPADLIDLFRDRRPVEGYDWDIEDPRIRDRLNWPFETLSFDVEHGFWWPNWGERPESADDRAAVLRAELATAPRLIPLIGHRFLPETPSASDNPIFSMYGSDTIYYGANLEQYFANEFNGRHEIGPVRHIPFWSDLVEQWQLGRQA
jgi:hypothetical protein